MTSHDALASTVEIAVTEALAAFHGGDDGYGAMSELLGSDELALAVVNTFGFIGEILAVLA